VEKKRRKKSEEGVRRCERIFILGFGEEGTTSAQSGTVGKVRWILDGI
jgi:hypothetical protein